VIERREQELDLRDYLAILSRRQWLIILTLLVVIVATTFYTLTQTELYQAESRVLLRSPYVPYAESATGGPMEIGVGLLSQSYDIETEMERIKNPELIKEARSRLPEQRRNAPMTRLLVRQVGKTAIIAITVESPVAQFAAELSQELAAAYIEHTRRMRQVATEQALKFVIEQAEQAKRDLDRADEELRRYKQTSRIVDIDAATSRVVGQYYALVSKLEEGRNQVRLLDTQLAALEAQRKAINPRQMVSLTFAPTSAVGQTQARLEQLMVERLTLLKDYTEGSRRVRQIDAQIAELQEHLKAELAKATPAELELSHPELQELRKRRVELETQRLVALASNSATATMLGRTQAELQNLPSEQVRFQQLDRRVKVAETAYSQLLAQEQILRIQKAAAVASAFVLSRAEVPLQPVSPKLERNVMTGAVVGLFLGLVVALLADRMDDTFRNPKEMERLMRLPVLGMVRLKQEGDPVLLAEEDDRSPFMEAFRTLRANMRFTAVDGQAHTVLLTSAGAGEGKSTCAANLAIASARAGQRVLLVDSDMRRPTLHEYFKVDGSRGLTNVLVRDMALEDALQETSVAGLRLLPSGALPPNPVVLIESEAMRQLLDRLRQEADLVILDSPPALIAADAQIMSSLVDATLLVIDPKVTRREMAQRALELLHRAKATPLGLIVNKARQREQGYYYYYYYHYDYHYHNGERRKRRSVQP